MKLSPMDYYFYRPHLYTIQFVFEYLGRIEAHKLQAALEETAKIYRPLKYKLRVVSNSVLEFEESQELVSMKVVEMDTPPLEFENLIDPIANLPGLPLFKMQLSYFDQRTFVCVSFSHMIGDGYSFLSFLKALSNNMLALPIKENPCHDRSLLYSTETNESPIGSLDRLFQKTGYITPRPVTPKNSKLETLYFSFEELKRYPFSPNSIIMATLLQKYHKSIPLTEDRKLIVRCPVDYRKIYSKVPANYFGNAVRDAVAIFDPDTFEQLSLHEIAERIQESIQRVDEQSVHDSLQALDDLRLEHSTSIFNELGCPGLLVSNLSKFPLDEIDLGSGVPVGVHHASQNPRLAIILSHPKGYEVHFKLPVGNFNSSILDLQ